jgi:RNA polymerase sigma factor (sigma-70 family)
MRTTKALLSEYPAINKAIGTHRRRGVPSYIDQDELISAAALALAELGPADEGLQVTVAKGAMVDAIRRNEVRNRGRIAVRKGIVFELKQEDRSIEEMWNWTVFGSQNLRPEPPEYDLWEAMKALSPEQYRAITLFFWGHKTQKEIAAEMGVNQATVSRILKSAKKLLYSCITRNPRAVTKLEGEEQVHRTR